MSNTSSPPVLQGRRGTVLSAENDGLILERPGEELHVPAFAIARIHAEGRSVAVELRAPAGVEPTVHRIEDVSEAAALAFADAVNARLPEQTEEIDGAACTVLHALASSRREQFVRRLKRFVFGCLGTVVALCVAVGAAGGDGLALAIAGVPIGVITTAGLGFGAYHVWTWNRERRLLKHGITVVASTVDMPGMCLYTDTAGTNRTLPHLGFAPNVRVGYDPRDPSDAVVLQEPSVRRLNIALGAFVLFCGLNGVALLAAMAVDAFSGSGS
ncbi:hypothetical protein ACFW2Y_33400 [Streptomyces sp. NPDC058877]|uniref:hypothetical protein n=1 Tax=unclassified Streptomyces TaxID=2593676 RepID=UPI0036902BF5